VPPLKVIPVNKLRIPLSTVAKSKGFALEEEVSEADLRPTGAPKSTLVRVRVAGTVSAIDTEILFDGVLQGTFERPCDRCLALTQQTVDVETVWYFEPGLESPAPDETIEFTEEDAFEEESGDDRVRFFDGKELDFAPHVWEAMVLEDPSKLYCSEDCPGLCPKCGANLNDGACGCAPDEAASGTGLAALKDLFPDLPSETPED